MENGSGPVVPQNQNDAPESGAPQTPPQNTTGGAVPEQPETADSTDTNDAQSTEPVQAAADSSVTTPAADTAEPESPAPVVSAADAAPEQPETPSTPEPSTPSPVVAAASPEPPAAETETVQPSSPAPTPTPSIQPASADSTPPAPATDTPVQPSPPVGSSAGMKPARKLPLIPVVAVVVVVVLLLGIGGYLWHQHSAKKTNTATADYKVGLMMAFSGGSSAMGYGTSKGVALAKKQLNANNITVVDADSQCDPTAAETAIHKLIQQHVVAIIGDGCSSASLAVLPTANNAQIPLVSPSASSTKLSIGNNYFFRVIPNDNHQGAYMAQTIYNKGIRTAAVFYTNEPYGASIEQAFQNSFESLGGKVVATAMAQPNTIDLSSQIAQLKAANPQAIFFAPNSVTTGIAAVKLARQAGIAVPFFGADVFYDQSIITNAASAVEGMEFTTFPTGTPAFNTAIDAAYPNATQLYAAPEAYDAFKAIYLAIQHGATTGQEIKQTLPLIKFQGVSANISFDQYHDLATNGDYQYALFQVKDGKFVQQN